jgi:hypothetical protein
LPNTSRQQRRDMTEYDRESLSAVTANSPLFNQKKCDLPVTKFHRAVTINSWQGELPITISRHSAVTGKNDVAAGNKNQQANRQSQRINQNRTYLIPFLSAYFLLFFQNSLTLFFKLMSNVNSITSLKI